MNSSELTILTVGDVAKILKVGRSSAYELVNQKDFPSIRIGRNIRVLEDELKVWLKSNFK